jgi:F-type H+-transporting ATPase subunit gamma
MPSLRDIRRRIRSVRNTAKITKAMELVAASRLRRAQMRVTAARPYADAMRALISELSSAAPGGVGALHPLLAQREVRAVGVVLVTPDRGLAGALNTNIIRRGTEVIVEEERNGRVEVVTVGRRGQDFLLRRGRELLGTFTGFIDKVQYDHVIPIARVIMDGYANGQIDRAVLIYPRFLSTLSQRPEVIQLLPIQPPESNEAERRQTRLDYIFEPDPISILEQLLPRYVEVQIYQALIETAASFYSAQMVAMRNATDNANDLVQSLSLTYNKVRQAGITREVTEIASAAEAMAASASR